MGVWCFKSLLWTSAGLVAAAALASPVAAIERGPAPPLPIAADEAAGLAPAASPALEPTLVPQLVGTIEPIPGPEESLADEFASREPRFAQAPSRTREGSWERPSAMASAASGWEALWGWWPAASAAMTAQAGDLWAAAWKSLAEGEADTAAAADQWQVASGTSAQVDADVYEFIQAHDGTSAWSPSLNPRNDREALAVLTSWCRESLLEDLVWARHRAATTWRALAGTPEVSAPWAATDRWVAAWTGRWAVMPAEGPLGFDTIIDSPERILFLRSAAASDDWAADGDWNTPGVSGPASQIDVAPWAELEVEPPLAGRKPGSTSLDQATAERLWSQQVELLRPLCLIYARWLNQAARWLEKTPAAIAQAGRYLEPDAATLFEPAARGQQAAADRSATERSEESHDEAAEGERAAVGPSIEDDGDATWNGPAVLDFGL